MAAEVEEVIEEEAESTRGGGLRAMLLPVLLSVVLTSGLMGAGFYFLVWPKLKKDAAPVAAEGHEGENAEGHEETVPDLPDMPAVGPAVSDQGVKHTGIYHHYDSFVVSIFDREKVHYLRIKIALELSSEKIVEEISLKDPQIKDSLIFVLGDFTVRELLDNQAKLLVKEVLIKTMNKILGKGKVVDIYFTEFVVQ